MKETIEHRDRLGRLINVGDFVAAADNNRLSVGVVCKLNPKMVQYKTIHTERYWSDRRVNKYPDDVVIVEGTHVTFYILKNSGT
jgi:hypothetical protein